MKQILKGKLVKMIEDTFGIFDDCLISPKVRQILLHWGYELTKKKICCNFLSLEFLFIYLFLAV